MYSYLKEDKNLNLKNRGTISESKSFPEILESNNVENKQEKMYRGWDKANFW